MKRIKIKASYLLFLSLLLVSSFSSVSNVNGQDYSYPSDLTVDALYEWEVISLLLTGTISTPYLDFGDDVLAKGDTFGVNILQSVNNVTNGTPSELLNPANIWAEFYLNGEFKTNQTDEVGLIELDWLDFANVPGNYFFIEPTTFENVTGTYNYFEILNNAFPQIDVDTREELSYYAYYGLTTTTLLQSSKLTSKSWTLKYDLKTEEKIDDFTDPENWEKEITTTSEKIEIRFNVKTGILSYINYDYVWHYEREIEGSFDRDDRAISLIIESLTVPTGAPFSWSFAFLSLVVVGFVFYKKKRK